MEGFIKKVVIMNIRSIYVLVNQDIKNFLIAPLKSAQIVKKRLSDFSGSMVSDVFDLIPEGFTGGIAHF